MDKAVSAIVVDLRKSRIYRYTPTGKFLGEIGLGAGSGPANARCRAAPANPLPQ